MRLDRLEISHGTVQPLPNAPVTNAPGTTTPGLDYHFANALSWIKPWQSLRQYLMQHDRYHLKKPFQKVFPAKNA